MRTFEIPCMGGFMLHERSTEAERFFPERIACDFFDSPKSLVTKVQYWLNHGQARIQIAEEAYRRAMTLTYREWASSLVEYVRQTL
jgi:spore maturation protein CgeB